jgi:hypothetical protein
MNIEKIREIVESTSCVCFLYVFIFFFFAILVMLVVVVRVFARFGNELLQKECSECIIIASSL